MSLDTWKKRYGRLDGTFIPLLFALVFMLVAGPLLADMKYISMLLVALLLVTGIFTIQHQPQLRRLTILALGIVLALLVVADYYNGENKFWSLSAHLAISLYMVLVCAISLKAVLASDRITSNTIIGAFCGYLLIAYIFAYGYASLEDIIPGSIQPLATNRQAETLAPHKTHELLYFSFTTLTTTGYGDMTPATPMARSMATLEMLTAQFYLAAFVARLVGVLGMKRPSANDDER